MAGNNVLRWIDGAGWLIFSGGTDSSSEVRALALTRAAADGGVAYIGLDVDDDEEVLEDMSELGAPTGYLVNIVTEDDDTIRKRLIDAAIIVIPDNFALNELRSSLMGAPLEGLKAAFENGAVILIEGAAITLFGGGMIVNSGDVAEGFGWVEDALLLPAITSISQSEVARIALEAQSVKLAVGIGVGSGLALGPTGEVEAWGQKQVTVALAGAQP